MKYKVNLLNFLLTSIKYFQIFYPLIMEEGRGIHWRKEVSHHKVKVYAYRKARRLLRIGNRKHSTRR